MKFRIDKQFKDKARVSIRGCANPDKNKPEQILFEINLQCQGAKEDSALKYKLEQIEKNFLAWIEEQLTKTMPSS
tara:strand:- start:220 stop:444 length:225 start_codon:yes stop_codon:yes gene_type:complete